MLVLSRKAPESIKFPELGITVEVLRISGKQVRLGIKAPPEVKVLRGELDDQKDVAEVVSESEFSTAVVGSVG